MRHLAFVLVLFVPDPATRFQWRAVHRHGASVVGPRCAHCHQMPPEAADQTRQVLGECREPALPSAAGRNPPVLLQKWPHLLSHRVLLVKKRQQGVRRIEAANDHDDQHLQDEPVGIRVGSSSWTFGWDGWPGEPIHKDNQADK